MRDEMFNVSELYLASVGMLSTDYDVTMGNKDYICDRMVVDKPFCIIRKQLCNKEYSNVIGISVVDNKEFGYFMGERDKYYEMEGLLLICFDIPLSDYVKKEKISLNEIKILEDNLNEKENKKRINYRDNEVLKLLDELKNEVNLMSDFSKKILFIKRINKIKDYYLKILFGMINNDELVNINMLNSEVYEDIGKLNLDISMEKVNIR